jgi:mannose-6-phosphate isomerase-like protein (cupin superfamily)
MRGFGWGLIAGMALTVAALAAPRWIAVVEGAADGKASYRIVLENERVRVREAVFPAGVTHTGMHTHEYAHVGVILTGGSLLFTNPDGTTETVEFAPGSVGFRPARATHDVGNPGSEPMRVIEVELK